MTYRPILMVLITLLFALTTPARADALSPEKRADIEQLLAMTGALSLGKQMAGAMVGSLTQSLKQARPDIPQRVLDMLPEEVIATFEENMDSFKDAMIPIYDRHFTGEEVKEMIRFYATPLGQKTIKVMPALMQEGMVAGQRWGQSLGPKINQRVTSRLRQQGVKI